MVLSGLGSDGALGLEAIGAAAGLAMAQQPDTAARPEMPGQAATTGMCDHVLPPEDLARTLMTYAAHVHRLPSGADGVARHREVLAALPQVCDLLCRATGNDFRHYKSTTLVRRIERRMQVLQIAGIADYLDRLEDDGEARTLFRELLIGVTAFFRDTDAFDALAAKVLAPLLTGRAQAGELRIWGPGCATGEEAYSIAILVREALEGLASPPRVHVFATDIDERALATARRGSYPQGIAAQMSPERLARFFVRKGRRYQVSAELREMGVFTAHNLISDPPFSWLDLISCRNLLIYLGPHLQKKLFPVFHYALKPGGYLFLGPSECLAGQGELFRAVDARSRLAQRKDVSSAPPSGLRDFSGSRMPGFRGPDQMAEPDLGAIAQRILLAEFAPRYAIVSGQGQVIHLSEGADRYLQPPVGSFSGTVTRMTRPVGGPALRAWAGRAAAAHGRPRTALRADLRRTRAPAPHGPAHARTGAWRRALHDRLPGFGRSGQPCPGRVRPRPPRRRSGDRDPGARTGPRAREVERAAQDQEAANEELKSSNKELLSMNEELQSANEKLEAAREPPPLPS